MQRPGRRGIETQLRRVEPLQIAFEPVAIPEADDRARGLRLGDCGPSHHDPGERSGRSLQCRAACGTPLHDSGRRGEQRAAQDIAILKYESVGNSVHLRRSADCWKFNRPDCRLWERNLTGERSADAKLPVAEIERRGVNFPALREAQARDRAGLRAVGIFPREPDEERLLARKILPVESNGVRAHRFEAARRSSLGVRGKKILSRFLGFRGGLDISIPRRDAHVLVRPRHGVALHEHQAGFQRVLLPLRVPIRDLPAVDENDHPSCAAVE